MEEHKTLKAIDINLDQVESVGVAYYRIGDPFIQFLKKCELEHEIIGFEYDGSRNFGIILGKKWPPAPPKPE